MHFGKIFLVIIFSSPLFLGAQKTRENLDIEFDKTKNMFNKLYSNKTNKDVFMVKFSRDSTFWYTVLEKNNDELTVQKASLKNYTKINKTSLPINASFSEITDWQRVSNLRVRSFFTSPNNYLYENSYEDEDENYLKVKKPYFQLYETVIKKEFYKEIKQIVDEDLAELKIKYHDLFFREGFPHEYQIPHFIKSRVVVNLKGLIDRKNEGTVVARCILDRDLRLKEPKILKGVNKNVDFAVLKAFENLESTFISEAARFKLPEYIVFTKTFSFGENRYWEVILVE